MMAPNSPRAEASQSPARPVAIHHSRKQRRASTQRAEPRLPHSKRPSPPIAIDTRTVERICPGSAHLGSPRLSPTRQQDLLLEFSRMTQSGENSPRVSNWNERNAGCLKRHANLKDDFDDLRACRNCASKFYANKANHMASSFFCSGECIWTAIMKEEQNANTVECS